MPNGGEVLRKYDQPQEPLIAPSPRFHVQAVHRAQADEAQGNSTTTSQFCTISQNNRGDCSFICKDMRPYSVVENDGFRQLMKVAEPHYVMVSRKRLSQEVIPNMYRSVKENVKSHLQSAERVGDTWTSVATQSYMSVTAHFIDDEWNLVSYVLQTRVVPIRYSDRIGR